MPKNKKKPAAGAAEGAEAAAEEEGEVAPEPAAAEAAATAAPAPAAAAEGDGEEDGDEEPGQAKKKNKKKKKGKGEAAEEGEAAVEAPPAAAPAAADEEAGESGEEEEGDGAAGAKKKKKKPKKKGGIVTAQKAEDVFSAWCVKALEATVNGAEKLSEQERMTTAYADFSGYSFGGGSLRPALVTEQVKMPEGIAPPDYATDDDGISQCERIGLKETPILEGKALETMKEACRLGREVLDMAGRFMKAGVTGDEIDRIVHMACIDRKIYPSPLNYFRFPKSVCVSPNEVICHGIPDCRPIQEGDVVNLDISIYHQGYHSDLNETFFIGKCDEDAHRLVKTAYDSLHAAAKQIRPGTLYRDLGHHIHQVAQQAGCAVVTTYCGHGVGELFHGPPKVPHYRKNKAVGIMKPGHVFTVEPMINLGANGGDKKWPDDWTAVTLDGKRSAQFEQTFLVTETGVEVLTARPGLDRGSMPDYNPAMFQR